VGKKRHRKNVIGRRLVEARQKNRPFLTQDALSGKLARLGIQLDRAAIAKIENDLRYVRDYELKAIAEVLGSTSIGYLTGKTDEGCVLPAAHGDASGEIGCGKQACKHVPA
jgi:HTH-type transcriptional regulator, cell division transcriptional repressor